MSIELDVTNIDDPAFVSLVCSFVDHYTDLYRPQNLYMIHVDNWFGERWLGFCGKFRGIAGVRQRRGQLGNDYKSLGTPPFRPSRIVSSRRFERTEQNDYHAVSRANLHHEKNGGRWWRLYFNGLYFWYSGNTASNSTACLMIYELNTGGENAWYVQFDKDADQLWQFTRCRNIQPTECVQIVRSHYEQVKAVSFSRITDSNSPVL